MSACYKIKTRQEGCLNSQSLGMAGYWNEIFHVYVLFYCAIMPLPSGEGKCQNIKCKQTGWYRKNR